MVWAEILFGYRANLPTFTRYSLTAVRYRGKFLDYIVRLYTAAIGPAFAFMDANARPH